MKKSIFKKRKVIIMLIIILIGCFELYLLFGKATHSDINRNKEVTKCNDSTNKPLCYEGLILEVLKSHDIEEAFDLLDYIYGTDKEFAANCHYYTHLIGGEAYHRYKKNEELKLSPKTTYCGYGFYHGFVENLLQESNDIEEVRQFCFLANKSLSEYTKKPSDACFHGIGHGAVDGDDAKDWGNSQALVNHGLEICSRLPFEKEQKHCASGAYNSLALAYVNNKYKLKGNPNNPFNDCTLRGERPFQASCFDQMNMYVLSLTDHELLPALRYAEKIPKDFNAQVATQGIASAASLGIKSQKDLDKAVFACKSIQKRLVTHCVYGIIEGLIEFGKPNAEYELTLDFCNNKQFTEEQKTSCFTRLSANIISLYSSVRYAQICQLFPERFRSLCTKR